MSKLTSLYKKVPELKCIPGCFECCGPVPVCDEEARILKLSSNLTPTSFNHTCSYASSLGCKIYNDRPFLCRLFGVVEKMKCPKVKPDRVLTQKEEKKLMKIFKKL
jgi:hypothetical protein